MADKRVILAGSHRTEPVGLEAGGAADPQQQIRVTVMVRRIAAVPPDAYRSPLSRDEFQRRYGADPADMQKVADFAASYGLAVESSDLASRRMVLTGTLGDASAAFGAQVRLFRHQGRTFRGRSGALTVPAELDGVVEGVFGFDERPQARTHYRRRIRPAAVAGVSYTPDQIAAGYQFPQGVTGAGQAIGIIELGGGYETADLASYFSGLGISPGPTVTSVPVDGATNQPGQDPNGADGEVELDVEVAGVVAPGASILVFFAPNTTQGFLDAITTAIHGSNPVNIISISWGGAEPTWTQQALQSYDQAFQDAGALGITVCVASGDNGSSDGQADGAAHVDFPASSPNVLACGGTTLQLANGGIQSEVVWNDGANGGATGGGVSETFPLPAYQSPANVPASVNTGFAGRGVPDVAGDADPATGYQIVVDGQSLVIGGTSAVAPLFAGLVALINQQLGKPAGFLNPLLYANAAKGSSFRDIVSGNNGAYSAGPGWDACTGWGSPVGTAIAQLLAG